MNNKIYHLRVEAYTKRFGSLKGKEPLYSELFFSHEKAWEKGKERLHYMAQELFEHSGYNNMQEFLRDGQIDYFWRIDEHDAANFGKCERPETNDYDLYPPTYIEQEYDFDGELSSRNYVWKSEDFELYRQVRENDNMPEAGTKFNEGDFVQLKKPKRTRYGNNIDFKYIFLVVDTPRRDEEGRLKENTYGIETVGKKGEYLWDWDWYYPFSWIHEDELVKYEGDIDKNSPLMFLRRVFAGEFDGLFTDDIEAGRAIVRKLESYEILLDPCLSWREIPELAMFEKEAANENI